MTVTPHKPESAQSTNPLSDPEFESKFNWRNCWYPVCFRQDFSKDRPYAFSLYDEPFVIFQHQEELICLTDRCPHRAAKLSDGQIIDGKLECLYHGWQFGREGECLHIPQLSADGTIPVNAGVRSHKVVERQGLIWIWPGAAELADEQAIPIIPQLDKPGFVHSDKLTELPCDISYVIEHMLDPAHIHITHHGNQGDRAKAQPLDMEIIESSVQGFRGRFRETTQPNQTWRYLDFLAPSLAHLHFPIPEKGWFFGQAFYFFPLGKGRCRILTRSYRNFATQPVKLMPRWWIHLRQNKIIAEDLAQLVGQQNEVERLGQSVQQVYSPIPTCDTFAMEYRKWLDRVGASLPYYRGYLTSKGMENKPENQFNKMSVQPLFWHTELCGSCNQAYQVTQRVEQSGVGVAIVLAALAILSDGSGMQIGAVLLAIAAVIVAVFANKLKHRFEAYSKSH